MLHNCYGRHRSRDLEKWDYLSRFDVLSHVRHNVIGMLTCMFDMSRLDVAIREKKKNMLLETLLWTLLAQEDVCGNC